MNANVFRRAVVYSNGAVEHPIVSPWKTKGVDPGLFPVMTPTPVFDQQRRLVFDPQRDSSRCDTTGTTNTTTNTTTMQFDDFTKPVFSSGNGAFVANRNPPPIQRRQQQSTPAGGENTTRARQKQNRHCRDQTTSRSRSVRGATNLEKETRLLRGRLDRVVECYQQTVASASQSQTTVLESLRAENERLRSQIDELENETRKQFSDLEDRDELLREATETRAAATEQASALKKECQSLANEVAFLKDTVTNVRRIDLPGLVTQNEELGSENESLRNELSARARTIEDLERELINARMGLPGNKENNKSPPGPRQVVVPNQADGGATSVAEKNTVALQESSNTSTGWKKVKGKRRKSLHSMTLRGSR